MDEIAQLIDQRAGPYGEVALRRRGQQFEIIANGCFLMDSSDGRSERLLVSSAVEMFGQPEGASLLIAGLGIGFSLAEASSDLRLGRICVVERERAIIDWHTCGNAPLRPLAGTGHTDQRTRVVHDDLLHHLATRDDRYDVVCLDIDNGPDWTVTEDNQEVYEPRGLDLLEQALTERGVLSVWSAAPAPDFTRRLESRFSRVETLEIPLLPGRRSEPDVVILASRA